MLKWHYAQANNAPDGFTVIFVTAAPDKPTLDWMLGRCSRLSVTDSTRNWMRVDLKYRLVGSHDGGAVAFPLAGGLPLGK